MPIHSDATSLSATELAMLTPGEREAVLEPDDTPNARTHREAALLTPAEDRRALDPDGEPEAVITTSPPAQEAEVPAPAARPVIQLDAEQRDFAGDLANLRNRYEEGEISQADYDAGLIDIGAAKAKAQVTQQLNAKFAQQDWDQAQESFYATHTQYNGPAMRAALGDAVERLERQHGGGLSSSALLARAAEIVDRELGVAVADDAHSDRRSGARSDASDKFAALDRLTGMEYEAAIMRLTPAEQRAYLQEASS